jgi:hypothetical protein
VIQNIGILVNDSPFKLKYDSEQNMPVGSAFVGALFGGPIGAALAAGIEGRLAEVGKEKKAVTYSETFLTDFSMKEVLAQKFSLRLEQYGYSNIKTVSSLEEAKSMNLDTVVVCDVAEWGINRYPQADGSKDSVAVYMRMTVKLIQPQSQAPIWSYILTYLQKERKLPELETKTILIEDLQTMMSAVSEKTTNRLFNS